jgi:cyclic beta-1,2-glucan synthetase
MSADIYSTPPHVGRGGWTWYTGSAGLMYRAGLESILGFHLQGNTLMLAPCIPKAWPGFTITFRYHGSVYDIQIENPQHVCRGVASMEFDGTTLPEASGVPLVKDGLTHRVKIVLGDGPTRLMRSGAVRTRGRQVQ